MLRHVLDLCWTSVRLVFECIRASTHTAARARRNGRRSSCVRMCNLPATSVSDHTFSRCLRALLNAGQCMHTLAHANVSGNEQARRHAPRSRGASDGAAVGTKRADQAGHENVRHLRGTGRPRSSSDQGVYVRMHTHACMHKHVRGVNMCMYAHTLTSVCM